VQNFGEQPQPLTFDSDPTETEPKEAASEQIPKKVVPPKQDEYIWTWKVCLSSLLTAASHSFRLSAGIGDNKTYFLLVTFRLLVITKQISDTCPFFGANFHCCVIGKLLPVKLTYKMIEYVGMLQFSAIKVFLPAELMWKPMKFVWAT
jgi:hypothetical protein